MAKQDTQECDILWRQILSTAASLAKTLKSNPGRAPLLIVTLGGPLRRTKSVKAWRVQTLENPGLRTTHTAICILENGKVWPRRDTNRSWTAADLHDILSSMMQLQGGKGLRVVR